MRLNAKMGSMTFLEKRRIKAIPVLSQLGKYLECLQNQIFFSRTPFKGICNIFVTTLWCDY